MSEAVKIITSGKTKEILQDPADENAVIVRSKDSITSGDGARSELMPGKAEMSTTTSSNVFRLLGHHGIRNHFLGQISPTEFRAKKMDMIPLEIVVRRHAFGSFLQRNVGIESGADLGFLVTELFAKDDTNHDPLVRYNYQDGLVTLYDAHKPQSRENIIETQDIGSSKFGLTQGSRWEIIALARGAFTLLEAAWEEHGYMLVDMKIECGKDPARKLAVGDVIDADSMRLWRHGDPAQMVDKQLFRLDRPMEEVTEAYAEVAQVSGLLSQ